MENYKVSFKAQKTRFTVTLRYKVTRVSFKVTRVMLEWKELRHTIRMKSLNTGSLLKSQKFRIFSTT